MMERLTHYQKNGEVAEPYNRTQAYEFAKKLAQYEDLEEQGLLVRLPCKVGDTVYIHGCGGVEDWKIQGVSLSYVSEGEIRSIPLNIFKSNLGKLVFLTREEAEAALRKMGGDGE